MSVNGGLHEVLGNVLLSLLDNRDCTLPVDDGLDFCSSISTRAEGEEERMGEEEEKLQGKKGEGEEKGRRREGGEDIPLTTRVCTCCSTMGWRSRTWL